MQENCLFGSEGGAKLFFVPTPIKLQGIGQQWSNWWRQRGSVETWRAALRRSRVSAVSQHHFPAPRDRAPSKLQRSGQRWSIMA